MRDLRREGTLPSAPASGRRRLRITLALSAFAAALLVAELPFAAQAQIDPDDTGEGHKLGLSAEHNSGQTGTVTLLAHGPEQTVVVVWLASAPRGPREVARIRRAPSCRSLSRGKPTPLSRVESGLSRTTVPLALARLLSGNYIVEAFGRAGVRVSCGELHGRVRVR